MGSRLIGGLQVLPQIHGGTTGWKEKARRLLDPHGHRWVGVNSLRQSPTEGA